MSVPDLDRRIGILVYATGAHSIGEGIGRDPGDFIVAEVLEARPDFSDLGYPLYSITKVNANTMDVAGELRSKLRCRVKYWGLKDKRAMTTQFMQCLKRTPNAPPKLSGRRWRAVLVGSTREPLTQHAIAGNAFKIRVRGSTSFVDVMDDVSRALRAKEVPNFFGYQRFGERNPNHMFGRCIVKGECEGISSLELRGLPAKLRRLFVNAYQSYLFNLALSHVVLEHGGLPVNGVRIFFDVKAKPFPHAAGDPTLTFREGAVVPAAQLPGYSYRSRGDPYSRAMDRVLEEEGVRPREFFVDHMPGVSAEGGWRPVAILGDMAFRSDGGDPLVYLRLQRGSYATVVLREIVKPGERGLI